MTSALATIYDHDCTKCPLSATAHTVCMIGSGPANARVMIVGEAPGYNEDRQGTPFVGQAGQLLDEELERVGLVRDDIFVTNSQKCRPPENRKPTATERKACKPYLQAELDMVKPALVVTMGNSAMQSVLGSSGIMSKMNAVYEKDGNQVIPLVHPAFVLRDPTHMDAFRSGLQLVKRVLDGTNTEPETKINLIASRRELDDFLDLLQDVQDPIVLDIESGSDTGREGAGLEVWAPDWKLATIGFTWNIGESWVIPFEHPESFLQPFPSELEWLYDTLDNILGPKRLVNHNIKYDLGGLRRRGMWLSRAHFDTMVAAHLLDENRAKGLKPLAIQYLGAGAYAKDIDHDKIMQTPLDELAVYNGKDTDYTLRLYHLFRDELLRPENKRLLRIFMLISMPAVNTLIDVETRGFPVDVRRLRDRNLEIEDKLADLSGQMSAYVPEEMKPRINWNTSNFLLEFLFDTLELPVRKLTETNGNPAADKEVLLDLADEHPVMPLLLEYRKWAKWRNTYTRSWIRQLKQVGQPRLYPNYNVTGTVTGRLSSNFQQVPRNNYIRGIIGAPKGWTLIEADFSQIELRIAAMVSHDPTMMALYQQGADLHMDMASAIMGKPASEITKEERARAKPVSFGFQYGMGWRNYIPYARINYDMIVQPEQAQHYRTMFFLRFPKLVDWHQRQRRLVGVLGHVESPIGRRRRLPAIASSDKDKAAEAERQAINSPVQGFASDLTLLAMILLEGHEDLDPERCRMIGQVHDSIMFEVEEDYAEHAAAVIKGVMDSIGPVVRHKFGYTPSVPILSDVVTHRWWGGE